MVVIRRVRHAAAKGTTTGELVRRVAEALARTSHGELRFEAFFSEMKHRKVSALARLLERYPRLLASAEPTSLEGVEALASLPGPAQERGASLGDGSPAPLAIHQLDVETAIEIADGVPQRYPFWESHFLVSPVRLLELTPAAPRQRFTSGAVAHAEILVCSRWSSARRHVELCSGVACAAPAAGQKRLPALPREVKELLEALGKPGREDQLLLSDEGERGEAEARREALAPELARLSAALEASWPALPFPYPLEDDHRHEEQGMDLAAELGDALAPQGWARASRGFRKRTERGNELALRYDRGPLGNVTSASLSVRGATWDHAVALWPRAAQATLRIRSPQTARRYAANLAAAAAHAAATWAEPVEALYGEGEGWLPRVR